MGGDGPATLEEGNAEGRLDRDILLTDCFATQNPRSGMMLTPFTIVLWGTTAGRITTQPGPAAEEMIAANTSQPPCTPWAVGSLATTPGSATKQLEPSVRTVRGSELKLVYVEQGPEIEAAMATAWEHS
jgi:hypothetical protein